MAPEQPASRQVAAASHEDWRRIAGASSGRATITEDGIKIEPIYPRATNAAPLALRGAWKIIERVTASDGDGAIRQAAEAIAGGAQGIELVFEGSAHPFAS